MSRLEKRKLVVIVVGVLLLLVVIIVGAFLLVWNHNHIRKPVIDEVPANFENPDEEEFTDFDSCLGALEWGLELGSVLQIDNIDLYRNVCQTEDHYSKMISYAYDPYGNIEIYVNTLKRDNGNFLKLDSTDALEFSDRTIEDLLDYGSTYRCFFKRNGSTYQLVKTELMSDFSLEEIE